MLLWLREVYWEMCYSISSLELKKKVLTTIAVGMLNKSTSNYKLTQYHSLYKRTESDNLL